MRTIFNVLLIAAALAAAPASAALWTNQAGRVIEAELGEFDGVYVTLLRTNGTSLKLPLSALREADQRRVRTLKARSVAPAFVHAAYRDAVAVVQRFDRLPEAQRTDEGRKKAIGMACAVFDARINTRASECAEPAVQDEIKRLRASLARGTPEKILLSE